MKLQIIVLIFTLMSCKEETTTIIEKEPGKFSETQQPNKLADVEIPINKKNGVGTEVISDNSSEPDEPDVRDEKITKKERIEQKIVKLKMQILKIEERKKKLLELYHRYYESYKKAVYAQEQERLEKKIIQIKERYYKEEERLKKKMERIEILQKKLKDLDS